MVVARDDDVGGDVGPERTGAPAFVRDVHGAVGVGHGPDGVEVAHSGPDRARVELDGGEHRRSRKRVEADLDGRGGDVHADVVVVVAHIDAVLPVVDAADDLSRLDPRLVDDRLRTECRQHGGRGDVVGAEDEEPLIVAPEECAEELAGPRGEADRLVAGKTAARRVRMKRHVEVELPRESAVDGEVDRAVRATRRRRRERGDRDLLRVLRVDRDRRLAVLAGLVALRVRNDVDDVDDVHLTPPRLRAATARVRVPTPAARPRDRAPLPRHRRRRRATCRPSDRSRGAR